MLINLHQGNVSLNVIEQVQLHGLTIQQEDVFQIAITHLLNFYQIIQLGSVFLIVH